MGVGDVSTVQNYGPREVTRAGAERERQEASCCNFAVFLVCGASIIKTNAAISNAAKSNTTQFRRILLCSASTTSAFSLRPASSSTSLQGQTRFTYLGAACHSAAAQALPL